jgi:hypothetical protein
MPSLADHLDDQLSGERWFTRPFRVCYFKPFPDEMYSQVLENLPDNDCYQELPHEDAMRSDGTSTRTVLLLDERAPPFWRELSSVLCGPDVEEVFWRNLGFDVPVRAVCRLFRDFAGYRIAPHPDSSKKACTVQFYLPSSDSQYELGTSFYSRNADGSFVEVNRLPFLQNTGYCFKVKDNSWHGTDLKPFERPRDSLILTYYKD